MYPPLSLQSCFYKFSQKKEKLKKIFKKLKINGSNGKLEDIMKINGNNGKLMVSTVIS